MRLHLLFAATIVAALPVCAIAADADYHHVHVTAPSPSEGVKWYTSRLDCQPVADRTDAVACAGGVNVVFVPQPTLGTTQGTGVNHISFSMPDVAAKMDELESLGVRGAAVRLQRYPDGSTWKAIPGWFKAGFIFDPWGTRIELLEDPEQVGFHHIHLSATDPAATLAWYRDVLGGEATTISGEDAVQFGNILVLAMEHPEGIPAATEGRAIDHIAFSVSDLDDAASEMRGQGVEFDEPVAVPDNARTSARRAFITAPDNVRLAVVEEGWAGVVLAERWSSDIEAGAGPYDTPKTPWGAPDLQGVWTGNVSHSIPLERPSDLEDVENLTPEEAAARRESGTLGSIWGYEREWRDTTLGYAKSAPSTQVAMIVDPPDGRMPPRTERGQETLRQAAAIREELSSRPPVGPEDLPTYPRCITRGLPGMMFPTVYNNGLQITQGPGFVTIQKEMIHETRVIATTSREPLGENLKTWLGDPQGHWEGDTLVIETTNFNGRASRPGFQSRSTRPFSGMSPDMTLIERYTRLGPNVLEYQFTIDDPTVWTQSFTGRFNFELDDEQYELVEYSCHEGNYGMTNILSGARARDRELEEAVR